MTEGPVVEPTEPADTEPAKTEPAKTEPAKTEVTDTEAASTPRRRMKRSTRIGLIVIVVLAVIAAAAFAVSFFENASRLVSTDNAQVDGTQIPIVAPASGTLIDWTATAGAQLRRDQPVGRIQLQGAYAQPQLTIRAPATGTVATSETTEGAYVTAGTQLAVAYDPADIYITARVDETDLRAVRVGQPVQISVDAYPDTPLTGSVQQIQNGAAGVFSPFPQSNSGGNFQKVTQVIPVKVTIDDAKGLTLLPGMNVTANIRIR